MQHIFHKFVAGMYCPTSWAASADSTEFLRKDHVFADTGR